MSLEKCSYRRAGVLAQAAVALMIATGCGEKELPVESLPEVQVLNPAAQMVRSDFLEQNPGMQVDNVKVFEPSDGDEFYFGIQRINFGQGLELNDSNVSKIALVWAGDVTYTLAYNSTGEIVAILAK